MSSSYGRNPAQPLMNLFAKIVAHPLGMYWGWHGIVHAGYMVMMLSAYSEILGKDYLTVRGWITFSAVILGGFFLGSVGIIQRMSRDRMNEFPPVMSHYVSWFWHIAGGILTKTMILVGFCVFEYHFDVANFNAYRNTKDILDEETRMYDMWKALMMLVIVCFLHDTLHLARATERLFDVRVARYKTEQFNDDM